MNVKQLLNCLQLDNYATFHQDIDNQRIPDFPAFVDDRGMDLSFHSETTQLQFFHKTLFVNSLQQPGAKNLMHF